MSVHNALKTTLTSMFVAALVLEPVAAAPLATESREFKIEYFPTSKTTKQHVVIVLKNIAHLQSELGTPTVTHRHLMFSFYDDNKRPHVITASTYRHIHLDNNHLLGEAQQHLVHELFHALYQPASMKYLGVLEKERWATYLQLRSTFKRQSNQQILAQLPTIPLSIINSVSVKNFRTAGPRTSRAYYIANSLPLFQHSHDDNQQHYQRLLKGIKHPNFIGDLQQRLKKIAYYHGPIKNKMDARTRRALRRFQVDNGVDPSSNLSQATRQALGYTW